MANTTSPVTPSPKKKVPKFAPPGYSTSTSSPSLIATPPAPLPNAAGPSMQHSPPRVEEWKMTKETRSESGTDSYQTMIHDDGHSVDSDNGAQIPSSQQPSFQDGVLGAGKIGKHVDNTGGENPIVSHKRRRHGK